MPTKDDGQKPKKIRLFIERAELEAVMKMNQGSEIWNATSAHHETHASIRAYYCSLFQDPTKSPGPMWVAFEMVQPPNAQPDPLPK